MTADQFNLLLAALARLTEKPYTLTGAADWPILMVVGGALIAVISFMWVDLRSKIDGNKTDNEKSHDTLWLALRDCQHDCCPRKKE
jgi:hypothetical protein